MKIAQLLIKNRLRKTAYGEDDARGFRKAVEAYLKEDLKLKKVSVKKSNDCHHYGGKVTGAYQKAMYIDITTSEYIDIEDLLLEVDSCKFVYEDAKVSSFPLSYLVSVVINGTLIMGHGSHVVGTKYRDRVVSKKMLELSVYNDVDFSDSFKEYGDKPPVGKDDK